LGVLGLTELLNTTMNFIFTLVAILLALTDSQHNYNSQTGPRSLANPENPRSRKFVDLTHSFSPGIRPHFPGFPDEERTTIYNYSSGFQVHSYKHVGQWDIYRLA
jgi:hypothetical protein